jgi:hypothetical protein
MFRRAIWRGSNVYGGYLVYPGYPGVGAVENKYTTACCSLYLNDRGLIFMRKGFHLTKVM